MILKKKFDVNLFVLLLAVMLVSITMTYILADYRNRTAMHTLTVRYEYEISNITAKTERFFDNFSIALNYIDIARSDMENGLYHIELSKYYLETGSYNLSKNEGKGAFYYYNESNRFFNSSIPRIISAKPHATGDYQILMDLYMNYTNIAKNLTMIGKEMSTESSSASSMYLEGNSGNGEKMFDNFLDTYGEYKNYTKMYDDALLAIKNFYGLRE